MIKGDTPLICGGIYRSKPQPGRPVYTAMIVSLVEPTGIDKPLGLLQTIGYASERVSEGSDRLNEFDLISRPLLNVKKQAKRGRPLKKAVASK